MSSVNPYYTFQYSQPDEYRFSHDSVFLSRWVFEKVRDQNLASWRALDLCAGSGVVGMDFLFHCHKAGKSTPAYFDFLEVQEVYRPHFEENAQRLGTVGTQLRFVQSNYNDLQNFDFAEAYDLILANPPYFFTGHGRLSPSEFKNRCRFFMDSDFQNLLEGIAASLKKTGVAYLLLRDLPQHKWNVLEEARKICAGRLAVEVVGDIRGTHLVSLSPLINLVGEKT